MNNRIPLFLCTVMLCACTAKTVIPAWAPAGDRIKTIWAEKVDPANVHQEYPRPQLVRNTYLNLSFLLSF